MKIRSKLNEYKRLQKNLLAYLLNSEPDNLTIAHKVAISTEVSRLQLLINEIKEMPLFALEQQCEQPPEIHMTSALVKPKIKIKKIEPYNHNTWQLSS